jgi:hypothetical protein
LSNLSVDRELLEEYKLQLLDRYTAEELVELLHITAEDILEMFEDKVTEFRWR